MYKPWLTQQMMHLKEKERENGHLASDTIKDINDQYNKHTESMAVLECRNQEKLQLILDAFQAAVLTRLLLYQPVNLKEM